MLAVLGPTASGKSGLAEFLAQQRGGELINSDASALYRGLEVGVTKPSPESRRRHIYHLLDVVNLEGSVTLVDYQKMALRVMNDIVRRGKLPIMVGGSGLYARAVLDGYQPSSIEVPEPLRQAVRLLTDETAANQLRDLDPAFADRIDLLNPRRVARALEQVLASGKPVPPPAPSRPPAGFRLLKFVLCPSKERLESRIRKRTEDMWDAWREEVVHLEKKGQAHWLDLRKPIGYSTIQAHLRGELNREQAVDLIVRATAKLAKKQRTWLQKDTDGPDHHRWVLDKNEDWERLPQEALSILDGFLAKSGL